MPCQYILWLNIGTSVLTRNEQADRLMQTTVYKYIPDIMKDC